MLLSVFELASFICGVARRPFVARLGTLDHGRATLIDSKDLPNHLFGFPDLDLSADLSRSLWPTHCSGSGRAARVPVVTGKVLHQNNENPPSRLGSRRFLERVTLIAVLIENLRPDKERPRPGFL